MTDPWQGWTPYDLILRAMAEDHAAIRALTSEAQAAHRELARLMRDRADRLLGQGVAGDEHRRSDDTGT